MGVLDKFLDAIKLNDDYDDDGFLDDDLLDEEEDDDFLDDDFDEKPKKKFFDKFSKKKESDDNDDFDDVEEKAVKTAPKQASAPKQTASAPSPDTSCSIFQDYSNEKQPQIKSGPKYGSLCDQTFFYGRYA